MLTRMARLLTRMARMLTHMTRWLAGSHIIHTPISQEVVWVSLFLLHLEYSTSALEFPF